MRRSIPLGLLAAVACASARLDAGSPRRPVHTFSIVARDPTTGELGVAVQSHWFSVGSVVPWAKAGVGAVATQSFVNPMYGPRGLELMASGKPAADALAELVKGDKGEAVRQVAMVDAKGRVAAHTGSKCIEACGHQVGEGYSVQANMMENARVVPAMAKAYEAAKGNLAERLLAALEAAQKEGGDIRGQQSAAILVVKAKGSDQPWDDTVVSLRVEDHEHPVAELRRLVALHEAYEHMNAGDVAVEKDDLAKAREEYGAAARLAPDNLEVIYWAAVTLATKGQLDQAKPMFEKVFAKDPRWRELTRRLDKPGILPKGEEGKKLLDAIEAIGK
ncbi:MAG TPA: DUF1028 domain-containing protein [Planctomycetota bacterium]|nr:DUF1028 domain-containing protein [Planctomycetota bacterium]